MSAEIHTPFGQTVAPQPNADVIEILEQMLERARAGEIAMLAAAWVMPNRDIEFAFPGEAPMNLLISAVTQLNFRVLHRADPL